MVVQETNYWKIGIFVTVSFAAAAAALFYLGAQQLARDPVERVTYFDESVQGLESGARVKMRGVTVGVVKEITIAPDRRLVQVNADIYVDIMVRLGLGSKEELKTYTAPIPGDLRMQLASTGITGEKFLQLDFFPDADPPPELSFQPPRGYIPSTPSTMKSVESSFFTVAASLPDTLDAITGLAKMLEKKAGDFELALLQERSLELIARLDGFTRRADETLASVDVKALEDQLAEDLTDLGVAIRKADGLLELLESEEGPLKRIAAGVSASLEEADLSGTADELRRAARAYGNLASGGGGLVDELHETLILTRETLEAVQTLARTLERRPGAFLQGRPPDPPRPDPEDR